MFTPKYPPTDTYTPAPVPAPANQQATNPAQHPAGLVPYVQPMPVQQPTPGPARPVIQLTPGSTAMLLAGGTAVVLVVGAVLVSMLLAVAITAASLAVVAVVLRSLLKDDRKHR